jgi:hypothetical protein
LSHAITSQRGRTGRGGTLRRKGRDVVVACASVLVLAFLVLFAVAAPSNELSASVGSVVPRPGESVNVEGRIVGASGDGLEGAEVVVRRAGMEPARALTNSSGRFRVSFRAACATYDVSLAAVASGDEVATSTTSRLCPGDSLPVDARVVTHGTFLWVPGPR